LGLSYGLQDTIGYVTISVGIWKDLPSTSWARVQGSLGYQAMEYGLWSCRSKKKDVTLGIISWLLCRNVLEDTTSKAGHKTLPGGASQPHPRLPGLPRWEMPTSFQSLPPSSPRIHLHRTSSWFDLRARIQLPGL
jgi:hypothetical protein